MTNLNTSIKIVYIDNETDSCEKTRQYLSKLSHDKYQVRFISKKSDAEKAIRENEYDVFLIDYLRQDIQSLIRLTQKAKFQKTFILLTPSSVGNLDSLMVRSGANDCINKEGINSCKGIKP